LEKSLFTAATAAPDVRLGGLAPWRIHRLQAFVEEHLSLSIRLADLSGVVGLSVPHFSRAFRISFGQPPHFYVIQRRLERACHLMLTSDIALSELAVVCGFNDQAHFCRLFRRCGKTPAAWRRKWRKVVRASPAQLRIASLDIHPIPLPKAQDGIDNCANVVLPQPFSLTTELA
jgi:AraC-like DNA-binding protein